MQKTFNDLFSIKVTDFHKDGFQF